MQLWIGIGFLSCYLIFVLHAATSYIKTVNQRWLSAHVAAFKRRIESAGGGVRFDTDGLFTSLDPPRGGIRELLSPANWVGSREIAGWVRLHEAQRLEISTLSDEALEARFARAMGQIDELPMVRQIAWQQRWVALQALPATPSGARRQRWEADASQLLAELFNVRDAAYNQLVSLYGKAAWLLIVSYLAVVVLLLSGFGPVLMAGFLGGLVSRLQRLVYAKGRPTAYGTSWVPLFLAPLLGALVAWGGLQLLALLQSLGIVNLSAVFQPDVSFRLDVAAPVLGIAVLLGFSERFFNQLGSQAESVLSPEAAESASPAAVGSPVKPVEARPAGSPSAAEATTGDPAPEAGRRNGRATTGG